MDFQKRNKNWLIIIGSLIILIGFIFISYDYILNMKANKQDEKMLKEFYNNAEENIKSIETSPKKEKVKAQVKKQIKKQDKVNYIAVLKIPKIKLEKGLVDPNSKLNNVKYNLEWIDGSFMPNEKNGNVIIAGHSGNARNAYFRKLDKLVIGDNIFLTYNGQNYKYKIVNIYDIKKTGKAKIIKKENTTTITLITCRYRTNKQIIIIAEKQ